MLYFSTAGIKLKRWDYEGCSWRPIHFPRDAFCFSSFAAPLFFSVIDSRTKFVASPQHPWMDVRCVLYLFMYVFFFLICLFRHAFYPSPSSGRVRCLTWLSHLSPYTCLAFCHRGLDHDTFAPRRLSSIFFSFQFSHRHIFKDGNQILPEETATFRTNWLLFLSHATEGVHRNFLGQRSRVRDRLWRTRTSAVKANLRLNVRRYSRKQTSQICRAGNWRL